MGKISYKIELPESFSPKQYIMSSIREGGIKKTVLLNIKEGYLDSIEVKVDEKSHILREDHKLWDKIARMFFAEDKVLTEIAEELIIEHC